MLLGAVKMFLSFASFNLSVLATWREIWFYLFYLRESAFSAFSAFYFFASFNVSAFATLREMSFSPWTLKISPCPPCLRGEGNF